MKVIKAITEWKYFNTVCDHMEYFLIYCFFGWVYESIWCCMIYHRRGFINRGFLFGPWLPIYGIGFFIILGLFKIMKVKKAIAVFALGTVIAVIAELIASYIIDFFVGSPLWDYTGYFMNFDGRIALVPGLMFGFLIWLAICVVHPAIITFQKKTRASKAHRICLYCASVLFLIDLVSRIWLGSNI